MRPGLPQRFQVPTRTLLKKLLERSARRVTERTRRPPSSPTRKPTSTSSRIGPQSSPHRQAALEDEVNALRAQVAQVAVNRFVSSGSGGIPILTGYRRPSEQMQTEALISVVTQSSADAMDVYDEARRELAATQEEVAANQAELTRAQERFREAQQRAEEEVVHLQEVEVEASGG